MLEQQTLNNNSNRKRKSTSAVEEFTNIPKRTKQTKQVKGKPKQSSKVVYGALDREKLEDKTLDNSLEVIEAWNVEEIYAYKPDQDNQGLEEWFSSAQERAETEFELHGSLRDKIGLSRGEARMVYRDLVFQLIKQKILKVPQNENMDIYSGIDFDYWKSSEPKFDARKAFQQNLLVTFRKKGYKPLEDYPAF